MGLHSPSLLAQEVVVVRHSHLVELTQATVNLLLFQVVEYQLVQRLAAAVAVTEILRAHPVGPVAAAVLQEPVDLEVKVTPEALA
jgi:hypothetical protein